MSGLYLSYLANILLGILVLRYVYPQAIQEYIKRKNLREKQGEQRIRKVVEDVLREITKDDI
jgi:hypothetical protein